MKTTVDYVPDETQGNDSPKINTQTPVNETGTDLVTIKDLAIVEIFRSGGVDGDAFECDPCPDTRDQEEVGRNAAAKWSG